MTPSARLTAFLVELGFPEPHAEATARTAVDLARGLLATDDPDALYVEARDIVLDAAAEASDH